MIRYVRENSGVRGGLLGVLIPTARLAATPVNGLLAAALAAYRWRAGVPAADDVSSRNNFCSTMDIDCCSALPSWGGPSMSTSSRSEVGKPTLGTSAKKTSERVEISFRVGKITLPSKFGLS